MTGIRYIVTSCLSFQICFAICSYDLPNVAGSIIGAGGTMFGVPVLGPSTSNGLPGGMPCIGTVTNLPSWITGPTSFQPPGLVLNLLPQTGLQRSATISIAGKPFYIEQNSAMAAVAPLYPGSAPIGTMPHYAAQDVWSTTFVLINKSSTAGHFLMNLPPDSGTPLPGAPGAGLYLHFPQQPSYPDPVFGAQIERVVDANALLYVASGGPQNPPAQTGSGMLSGSPGMDGFALFRLLPNAQEAVVPLETRTARGYVLAFDNTNGISLAVAVQMQFATGSTSVGVVIRDDTGAVISDPGTSFSMASGGAPGSHTSFVLTDKYPVTAGRRGTIEFDAPVGGQIAVLGIRAVPLNDNFTMTTVPAIAISGNNGGSIAHIATGAGWQTTFVLVNAGTAAAQATLKFFATGTGAPLPIPLSFQQTGGPPSTLASSTTQTIAAGASLIVQSVGAESDALATIGSAQITTTGNVGGFVIFRYNLNGQEAVVPLENRTSAAGFVMAFDNADGTVTGIAVNSVSAQATSVPVIVRDETGAPIATETLSFAPNAHMAFTVADKYPITAGIRGTIEFSKPANGTIGVVGIRTPPALTFTTLPALAK